MRDLVKFLVKELADADDVDVVEIEKNGGAVDMDIYVGKADIGKIIGRQGRIAKALRAVVKAAAAKQGKRYNIAIKEKESKKEVSEDAIDEVVDKVVGDSAE